MDIKLGKIFQRKSAKSKDKSKNKEKKMASTRPVLLSFNFRDDNKEQKDQQQQQQSVPRSFDLHHTANTIIKINPLNQSSNLSFNLNQSSYSNTNSTTTVHKKKGQIFSYFESLLAEPIYEEIPDSVVNPIQQPSEELYPSSGDFRNDLLMSTSDCENFYENLPFSSSGTSGHKDKIQIPSNTCIRRKSAFAPVFSSNSYRSAATTSTTTTDTSSSDLFLNPNSNYRQLVSRTSCELDKLFGVKILEQQKLVEEIKLIDEKMIIQNVTDEVGLQNYQFVDCENNSLQLQSPKIIEEILVQNPTVESNFDGNNNNGSLDSSFDEEIEDLEVKPSVEDEKVRRELIKEQRVKCKLVTNWIKGEVILDSILENKAATKTYWEQKMKDAKENQRLISNNSPKLMKNHNNNTSLDTSSGVGGGSSDGNWQNFTTIESSPSPTPLVSATSTAAALKKPVIDQINNEIEELHLRELELHHNARRYSSPSAKEIIKSMSDGVQHHGNGGHDSDFDEQSVSDEFDSFEFNQDGSSSPVPSREILNSEELLIDTSHEGQELGGNILNSSDSATSPDSRDSGGFSASFQEEQELSFDIDNETPSPNKKGFMGVREDNSDTEDSKVVFSISETPIEKEIRLAREREEEFRREKLGILKQTPMIKKVVEDEKPSAEISRESTALGGSEAVVGDEKKMKSISSIKAVFQKSLSGQNRNDLDLQYKMATDRLKREIEEDMKREEELKRGRLLTPTLTKSEEKVEVESKPVEVIKEKFEEKVTEKLPEVEDEVFEEIEEVVELKPQRASSPIPIPTEVKEKITPTSISVNTQIKSGTTTTPRTKPFPGNIEIKSLRSNSLTSPPPSATFYSALSSISSPPPKTPLTPYNSYVFNISNKGGKYNSMQRYLLRNNSKLIISKNFEVSAEQPADAEAQKGEEKTIDPLTIVKKESNDDSKGDDDSDQEKKPKRFYIRAQDKIERELKEMAQREKELNQQRQKLAKCKSTSDLNNESTLAAPTDSTGENLQAAASTMNLTTEPEPEPELLGNHTKEKTLQSYPLLDVSQNPQNDGKLNENDGDENEDTNSESSQEILGDNPKLNPRRKSALISKWENMINSGNNQLPTFLNN